MVLFNVDIGDNCQTRTHIHLEAQYFHCCVIIWVRFPYYCFYCVENSLVTDGYNFSHMSFSLSEKFCLWKCLTRLFYIPVWSGALCSCCYILVHCPLMPIITQMYVFMWHHYATMDWLLSTLSNSVVKSSACSLLSLFTNFVILYNGISWYLYLQIFADSWHDLKPKCRYLNMLTEPLTSGTMCFVRQVPLYKHMIIDHFPMWI